MAEVMNIPPNGAETQDEALFGALITGWYTVVVEGKEIPRMLIRESDGLIEVSIDRRWVYQFPTRTAARLAIKMAANCMAIGEGYSHLGADAKGHPFAPTVVTFPA